MSKRLLLVSTCSILALGACGGHTTAPEADPTAFVAVVADVLSHCVAHVAWTATYSRKDRPDVAIDFDVHYFVQKLDGPPRVFGWVSGDESALLREHGIT